MTQQLITELVTTPWDVAHVKVSNFKEAEGWSTTAELALIDQRDENHRVTVEFAGTRDMRFAQVTSNLALILQVADIGDRGWEGVRYAVTDQGNGLISLYCRDIAFRDLHSV